MPETPRSTPIELSSDFSHARNVEAYEKARQKEFDLRQDEIKLDTDMPAPEQISRRASPKKRSFLSTLKTGRNIVVRPGFSDATGGRS